MSDAVVIISAKRTPMGNFGGAYKEIAAPLLGAHAIKAVMEETALSAKKIDAVYMGCVLTAGLGQAPARQAAHHAQLSDHTPCVTINKMCGSGMQSVIYAVHEIAAGVADIIIAGGMENMSRAPYLLPGARFGYRFGNAITEDHLLLDGLTNAYDDHLSMGQIAEIAVKKFHFDRKMQDDFAIESIQRAKKATESGLFRDEIAPYLISSDEGIAKANLEKIPQLKPSFAKDGTITAANASSISDGAAALLLMRASIAEKNKLTPIAKIIGDVVVATRSDCFPEAPITAIETLLKKINWTIDTVDLFEINEAFAAVTMAAMKTLSIPHGKVNVHGGACILGHPIGASGARILVTLIHALKQQHKKRGIATICIGGGEAAAIAIEV
ncbi:MAG: acetyl-CoA acetyltransferase [Gammaproteobacteria bacterium RIFCSPLOWO2_02_FULL_42_14]|nr:MAG: acetyl-CoA acetyltransferase [Gammaproteobacteria bacterium RIFCSPHIGHO2_02_FULL_42_43]OGT52343.1 MAG: acetyl-CoA acetyltransferase [Gammaproteobacteria bacterium RIFCSPHIGHO2_12_FULL_41_25]OGT61954.1 MAG: acetyl-CoA acetyltransferase [Gammaproteobacteria bacterium RIFCSPLOWO2_02_FULL_42_14]OGT86334.1 MAG: acetyl-CoA acetyltransferase [Gammaproteobacteria bacterium RIFCSPLOWO2_12_FULL_42_18]